MVRTYEQEQREGTPPFDYEVQAGNISFTLFREEDVPKSITERSEGFERIMVPTPGSLFDRFADVPGDGGRGGTPVDQDPFGIDVDLGGLDIEGLLRVIAIAAVSQTRSLLDIADYTQPIQQITVSGTNSIQNAGSAEVVVPQSDNIDIPTKKLYVRASKNNTAPIYIGDDDVGADDGLSLHKGEERVFDMNLVPANLYMVSDTAGQTVELLGVL